MKKTYFFIAFVILSFALFVSCTPAGAELGLVGKWKMEKIDGVSIPDSVGEYKLEIKNDDTIITTTTTKLVLTITVEDTGKITKADSIAKTITAKMDKTGETTWTYELSGDTLKTTVKDGKKSEWKRL